MSAWGAIGAAALGGVAGLWGQADANRASAHESRKNRNWQERLMKERHQINVNDLRKAGLNPMLAYGNNAASVPSGSAFGMESETKGIESHISNAMSAMKLEEEVKQLKETNKNIQSGTKLNAQKVKTEAKQQELLQHSAEKMHEDAQRSRALNIPLKMYERFFNNSGQMKSWEDNKKIQPRIEKNLKRNQQNNKVSPEKSGPPIFQY